MRTESSFVLSLIVLFCSSCSGYPKKYDFDIDPCVIESLYPSECYAVPLDPRKPEYSKNFKVGDTVVTPEEVAKLKKTIKDLLIDCGDRCQ